MTHAGSLFTIKRGSNAQILDCYFSCSLRIRSRT